jgi:tungstate transport system permease protein
MDLIWDGIRQAFDILAHGRNDVWGITMRSLLISGTATVLAMVLGLAIGSTLAFNRFPGRSVAIAFVNTGMGFPPVVIGLFVAIMLWRSGPLGDLSLIYTPVAMVIAQTILATPFVTGFTVAALGSLPPRLRPQLYALGASRLQTLWLVMQETRLLLLAAVMAGFGHAISEVGASMMVGGNLAGETRVTTTAILTEVSKGNFDVAIALSLILLALILVVNAVLTGVQQRGRTT